MYLGSINYALIHSSLSLSHSVEHPEALSCLLLQLRRERYASYSPLHSRKSAQFIFLFSLTSHVCMRAVPQRRWWKWCWVGRVTRRTSSPPASCATGQPNTTTSWLSTSRPFWSRTTTCPANARGITTPKCNLYLIMIFIISCSFVCTFTSYRKRTYHSLVCVCACVPGFPLQLTELQQ